MKLSYTNSKTGTIFKSIFEFCKWCCCQHILMDNFKVFVQNTNASHSSYDFHETCSCIFFNGQINAFLRS